MQEAGLASDVIRAFINNATVPYKATVDDILYLHDHKVPDDLVCDWIRKGGDLVARAANSPAAARSPDLVASASIPAQSAPAAAPVIVQQQPAVVYQTAPPVVYSTPAPVYVDADPFWYGAGVPISIGLGFGWGRSHWGYSHWGHSFPHHAGGHFGYVNHFRGGWGGHAGGRFHGHFGGHHR
jgi:hypothetical protein